MSSTPSSIRTWPGAWTRTRRWRVSQPTRRFSRAEPAGAHWHGALLGEGGGEAAFAEGGERAQRVVAHDDDGLGKVELGSGGLEGEDPGMSLPADLVLHVGRVGEGAHDGLAVAIGPPAKDHAPAVE
jgi:hypothetical protein